MEDLEDRPAFTTKKVQESVLPTCKQPLRKTKVVYPDLQIRILPDPELWTENVPETPIKPVNPLYVRHQKRREESSSQSDHSDGSEDEMESSDDAHSQMISPTPGPSHTMDINTPLSSHDRILLELGPSLTIQVKCKVNWNDSDWLTCQKKS